MPGKARQADDRRGGHGHQRRRRRAGIETEGRYGLNRPGVGAATARRIMERGQPVTFARDVEELRPYIGSARKVLQDSFVRGARALLEGTQGSGLSLFHGTYPYVTSRDTTVMGCLSEAGIPHSRVRRVVMVCRTYPIRVENPSDGTSGPLREITYGELASRSGIDEAELRGTEKTSTTRRQRRLGEFEWDQLQPAARTELAYRPRNHVLRLPEQAQSSGNSLRATGCRARSASSKRSNGSPGPPLRRLRLGSTIEASSIDGAW